MIAVELLKNHCHEIQSVAAGKTIFEYGEQGECMYAITSGSVDIYVGDTLVETVTQGGIFGEMALIDCRERSATAIAKTDCKVVPVDKECFISLLREMPSVALDVMHVMAERLRATDRKLRAMG